MTWYQGVLRISHCIDGHVLSTIFYVLEGMMMLGHINYADIILVDDYMDTLWVQPTIL